MNPLEKVNRLYAIATKPPVSNLIEKRCKAEQRWGLYDAGGSKDEN